MANNDDSDHPSPNSTARKRPMQDLDLAQENSLASGPRNVSSRRSPIIQPPAKRLKHHNPFSLDLYYPILWKDVSDESRNLNGEAKKGEDGKDVDTKEADGKGLVRGHSSEKVIFDRPVDSEAVASNSRTGEKSATTEQHGRKAGRSSGEKVEERCALRVVSNSDAQFRNAQDSKAGMMKQRQSEPAQRDVKRSPVVVERGKVEEEKGKKKEEKEALMKTSKEQIRTTSTAAQSDVPEVNVMKTQEPNPQKSGMLQSVHAPQGLVVRTKPTTTLPVTTKPSAATPVVGKKMLHSIYAPPLLSDETAGKQTSTLDSIRTPKDHQDTTSKPANDAARPYFKTPNADGGSSANIRKVEYAAQNKTVDVAPLSNRAPSDQTPANAASNTPITAPSSSSMDIDPPVYHFKGLEERTRRSANTTDDHEPAPEYNDENNHPLTVGDDARLEKREISAPKSIKPAIIEREVDQDAKVSGPTDRDTNIDKTTPSKPTLVVVLKRAYTPIASSDDSGQTPKNVPGLDWIERRAHQEASGHKENTTQTEDDTPQGDIKALEAKIANLESSTERLRVDRTEGMLLFNEKYNDIKKRIARITSGGRSRKSDLKGPDDYSGEHVSLKQNGEVKSMTETQEPPNPEEEPERTEAGVVAVGNMPFEDNATNTAEDSLSGAQVQKRKRKKRGIKPSKKQAHAEKKAQKAREAEIKAFVETKFAAVERRRSTGQLDMLAEFGHLTLEDKPDDVPAAAPPRKTAQDNVSDAAATLANGNLKPPKAESSSVLVTDRTATGFKDHGPTADALVPKVESSGCDTPLPTTMSGDNGNLPEHSLTILDSTLRIGGETVTRFPLHDAFQEMMNKFSIGSDMAFAHLLLTARAPTSLNEHSQTLLNSLNLSKTGKEHEHNSVIPPIIEPKAAGSDLYHPSAACDKEEREVEGHQHDGLATGSESEISRVNSTNEPVLLRRRLVILEKWNKVLQEEKRNLQADNGRLEIENRFLRGMHSSDEFEVSSRVTL